MYLCESLLGTSKKFDELKGLINNIYNIESEFSNLNLFIVN